MRPTRFRPGRGLSAGLRSGAAIALVSALTLAALSAQTPQPRTPEAPAPQKPPAALPKAAAPATLPSARTIIDRHIEAIGGRKAVLGHSSTHASGTMSMAASGVSGVVDVYAAKPNRSLLKLTLGGIGEVLEGFDGTVGWSVSAITGPMLALGKELEQKKFDAAYDAELHDSARYKSMQTLEQTTFESHPAYKVSLTHLDGTEDIEYYDVKTRFRIATVATRESPMGPMKVTLSCGDHRKFDDVLVPTTRRTPMRWRGAGCDVSWLRKFDKVPPSMFEPPAAIKALIK